MMNETNVYIGQKIRFYRKKKKISMKDMAIKLHVDCSTVSRYENGKRMINLHMLTSILEMLDISFNDIFPRTTLERINDNHFALEWKSNNMLPSIPKDVSLIIEQTNRASYGDVIVTFSINRNFEISRLVKIDRKYYGIDSQGMVVEDEPIKRLFRRVIGYIKLFDEN